MRSFLVVYHLLQHYTGKNTPDVLDRKGRFASGYRLETVVLQYVMGLLVDRFHRLAPIDRGTQEALWIAVETSLSAIFCRIWRTN